MYYLNPTYLWALLGLAVPLVIHLWSKKEGKTVKIGSVQLLKTADTKQSSSIKLNEFWLLLLRLFLISVLVLIMSNVHISNKLDNAAITYIAEPSLLQNKEFKSILDTISTEAPIRLLQHGFPEINLDQNHSINSATPNYWQLAEEMQSINSDSIVVFTSAYQSGFKGIRPKISKRIEWIPISIDKTSEHLLEAIQLNDQLELLVMNSSDQNVTFHKELLQLDNSKINWNTTKDSIFYLNNWNPINTKKISQVLLFYDASFIAESNYLEAGFKVISQYLNHTINLIKTSEIDKTEPIDFDVVIWLSAKPLINTNGKVVLFKSDGFTDQLIEKSSIQGVYYLTKYLDRENIEKDHLPEQLIQLLALNPTIEKQINEHDLRVMNKESMIPIPNNQIIGLPNFRGQSITKWLWFLFILLLISERTLSYYRSQ